ncbi:MAG: neutral/alkaline non-lysosomal ceramidase N-terminal domain-containing protein [Alphaproteobacteria bacterium]|nr:neutral/alkaline non-lysosomal ceramidase N-terminal domain-containing protein [Alphaproteobacteria bacterium]
MTRSLALALLLLPACNGAPTDTDPDDTDPGCTTYTRTEAPAPGPLVAGYARRRIPAPLGIGTAGFGPFGAPSSPTPFQEIYPGTQHLHGHPELKAVAISRGEGHEVVFLRVDAVGMFSQLRNDIVARASAAMGRDLDDALIIGATHTHSGPGRVVNTGNPDTSFFDFIADKFFPEFYDRFAQAAADAVVEALQTAEPAEVGFAQGYSGDAHNDRRCENGEDYENGSIPVVAVRKDGQVEAVVVSYAIHGTVFSIDDLYLTQDVHGAIEEMIEDRFDHPVDVLCMNSWGGDMSPGHPADVPELDAAFIEGGFQDVRRVGWAMAEAVTAALDDAAWTDAPEISLETHRLPIDRSHIGYPDDVFERFPYGGVYCSKEPFDDCDPSTTVPDLDDACLPFNEQFPAPSQTSFTVGTVGDFTLVTWPGEATTEVGEALMDGIVADHPDAGPFLFVGYAQDYLGYALLEDDWWQGGYEASGSLWGPKQGEYLIARARDAYTTWSEQSCPDVAEPAPLEPFPYTITAYAPETALTPDVVVTQGATDVGPEDVLTVTVAGRDPWLGTPLAWVETTDGTPVTRPNTVRVDSDDYNFDVSLAVEPSYADEDRADRRFLWTFRIPVRQPVAGGVELTPGSYVIKVDVPDGAGGANTVTSAPFTVAAQAGVTSDSW